MKEPIDIKDMDDYNKASRYLIGKILEIGDGFMLRAVKTLMDINTAEYLEPTDTEGLRQADKAVSL